MLKTLLSLDDILLTCLFQPTIDRLGIIKLDRISSHLYSIEVVMFGSAILTRFLSSGETDTIDKMLFLILGFCVYSLYRKRKKGIVEVQAAIRLMLRELTKNPLYLKWRYIRVVDLMFLAVFSIMFNLLGGGISLMLIVMSFFFELLADYTGSCDLPRGKPVTATVKGAS